MSIIIPTYKRPQILKQSLDSILDAISELDAEVIVVNDDSSNSISFPEFLSNSKLKVVDNKGKGAADARNYGAELSKGEILLFMDDDILLSASSLQCALAEYSAIEQKASLNINWYYPSDLIEECKKKKFGRFLINAGYTSLKTYSGSPDYWKEDSVFETEYFSSYCLLIKKDYFESIGGYRGEVPFGYEDYDFAYRAKKSGLRAYVTTNALVYHNENDRIIKSNWLNRKRQEGYGRTLGPIVSGHQQENQLAFSSIQKKLFNLSWMINPVLDFICSLLPNSEFFDRLYSKILSFQLGAEYYKGIVAAQKQIS